MSLTEPSLLSRGTRPTYDGNGNLTADSVHTYSWDAENNPINVDTSGVVYDALGRMVQINASSGSDEWVYGPTGNKLALMLGQTFAGAWIPLPGGGYRLYHINNGTTDGYRHADWLGSSRLSTSDTQTLLYDTAYAPFGEDYVGSGPNPDLQFTAGSLGELVASSVGSQGLFDFDYRKYRPAEGRWISSDPAGLAAANPADPQSWNRYAYVGNRPLNSIDPLGLVRMPCDPFYDLGCGGGGGGGGGGGDCDPLNGLYDCGPILPPAFPGGDGDGGGAGPSGPSGGGGRRIGGKWPNGETLGLPTGLNLKPMGLAGLIGLSPGNNCDWVCVTIGDSFTATGVQLTSSLIRWASIRNYYLFPPLLEPIDYGPPRLRRVKPKINCRLTPCMSANGAVIRAVPSTLQVLQTCTMATNLSMGGGVGAAPDVSDQFPVGQRGTQIDPSYREYNPIGQGQGNASGNAAAYAGSLFGCIGLFR